MSKSSRNQPVAFLSDAPVIDAESPVAASEAPETSESGMEPFPVAAEWVRGGPLTPEMVQQVAEHSVMEEIGAFRPTPVEPMSSQHELAAHIGQLLSEEGAEMASSDPEPEEMDVDMEAELNALAVSGAVLLPDGSLKISVIIPSEQVEILKEWANGAGESFESYVQTTVEMGLNAVINGGAVAG